MEKILFLMGLFPLVLFCLVLIIRKRKYLFTIPAVVLTLGLGVTACIIPAQGSVENVIDQEWMYYLVERSLDSGDYDNAAEYLEKMYMAYGDTPKGSVATLRLAVLKQDMQRASMIAKEMKAASYSNKLELTKAEKEFVEAAATGAYVSAKEYRLQAALYENLKETVDDPEEYGLSKVSDKKTESAEDYEAQLAKEIENTVEKSVEAFEEKKQTEQFAKAWRAAQKLQAAMDGETAGVLIGQGEDSGKRIEKYFEELTQLYEADSKIFQISEISRIYINAGVFLEEFDAIIQYAHKSGDKDALAAMAYLYMTERIDKRDLNVFDRQYELDNVVSKCEEIYEEMEDGDYRRSELAAYEDYLDAITSRDEDVVLSNLEERISDALGEDSKDAGSYIQCAAINSRLEDKNRVYDNLDRALENKDACEDEILSDILNKIDDIADKVSEDDEIRSFQDYLVAGYESSLPIKVEEVVAFEEFLNMGNTYINEKRTMINVGRIETEEFPVVRAYISTAGIDLEKKENLEVTDCGLLIEDFTIEKVKYDNAQIMLVCDNSGSMSGDIEVLKSAVEKFIETKNKGEIIGIVTFDSYVLQNTGLTKDNKDLLAAVGNFGAHGGTNIAIGVNAAFQEYDPDKNSLNVMIVMTDGQDSSYNRGRLKELREICLEKNVVLYTIGLGDVSAEYLKSIADSGMGSFVYSSNSAQLEELYSFIHNQLDNNYLLTYTAKDITTSRDRLLTVTSKIDGFSASREYSLVTGDDDKASEDAFVDNPNEVMVTKLGVSTIIKGKTSAQEAYHFTILGKGFSKVNEVSVSLKGDRQYSGLTVNVDNDQRMSVQLPADVEYGSYDVLVNVDGTAYTLSKLSIIKAGNKKEIIFGDYIFRAYTITEGETLTTLAGQVTMNDYLNFYGDISLNGSLEGNILVMGDGSGSYINGKGILPGILADYFDNKIDIPRLDGLTLYKESGKYDKFYTHGKSFYGPFEIYDPYIEVCPEYLNFTIMDLSFDFPLLNNILDYADSPFSGSKLQKKVVLSKENVDFVLNIESGADIDKELSLGPAILEMESFKLFVDTAHNDYTLGLAVELENIPIFKTNESVFGFEIGIKSGRFDSFDLVLDEVEHHAVVVPPGINLVTLIDFHVGLTGFAGEEQDASIGSRLRGSSFYGQTDVDFLNLKDVIPGLDSVMGKFLDIAILKMDDTRATVSLGDFNISLDTTAVLLEQIELGKVEVDLGKYDYKNYLLGIDREVSGIHLKVSSAYDLDFDENIKIDVSGASQIDVNNMFAGVMVDGNLNYNIKFFKRFTGDVDGNCLIGLHNNATQFTLLIKGTDHMAGEDEGVRVTFTKDHFFPEVNLY